MSPECPHGLPSLRCPDCRPGGPFVPPYEIATPDQVQDGLLPGLLVRRGGTPPTGYLIVDRPAKHHCPLPDRGRTGTAWRCDCGRLWVVVTPPLRQPVLADIWVRAGWLTRWRYRRAREATPSEVGAQPDGPPSRLPRGGSGVSSSTEGPTR